MANFPDKESIRVATLADIDEALANLDSEPGKAQRAEWIRKRDDAQQWLNDRAEYRVELQRRQIELLARRSFPASPLSRNAAETM